MIGTYRFYVDGKLILSSKNVITTEGAKQIRRYLGGLSTSFGDALALGVGEGPANISNTRMNFEIARTRVTVKSVDYTTGNIIFKGTLPLTDTYTIYEVGLWSQFSDAIAAEFSSRLLTTFDTVSETWTNVTADSVGVRTGVDGAKVSPAINSTTSVRNPNVSLDLSGYSAADTFLLAMYKPDDNISWVTLVFEDTDTGGAFTSPSQAVNGLPIGYNIIEITKSSFTSTGTISWDSINSYGLDVHCGGTAGSITLDAIRLEDTDTFNPEYTLISRSTISPALSKTSTAPMDIEYQLEVTIA